MTYMDWAWRALGVDLSLVWDPELWVKLQQAVVWREPNFFWNSLMDRVQYRGWRPDEGRGGGRGITCTLSVARPCLCVAARTNA